ncbi:hypothetical protein KLP28_11770 [Nocardioidaceae bacterium]|nr:hypothetical protein KLP28_11770 [Nocardioidaceae bacterium]
MTVLVAVGLLRWSQPLHPAAVGVDAWAAAAQRRAHRRQAVRRVAAQRRAAVPSRVLAPVAEQASLERDDVMVSAVDVVPAEGTTPDQLVDRHLDGVFAHLRAASLEAPETVAVDRADTRTAVVEPVEIRPEPETEPAPVEALVIEPLEPIEHGELHDVAEPAAGPVDEQREDDETWERVLGMLRRTEAGAPEPVADEAPTPAPRLSVVPAQRQEREPAPVLATVGAPAKVRRCGVCREPGHDRRRCPQAQAS